MAKEVDGAPGNSEARSTFGEIPNASENSETAQQEQKSSKGESERKILKVLLESRSAMTVYELSKASELPDQLVSSGLVVLMREGMVKNTEYDDLWAVTFEGEKWYGDGGEMTPQWVRSFSKGELDVTDHQVTVGASIPITFHIPRLNDGSFILWKCLPHCGKCCRKLDGLPLTAGDMQRLKRRFHYESMEEFAGKECNVVDSGKQIYDLLMEGGGYTLKREIHEREGDFGKIIPCRFLNASSGCSIYQDRPTACRVWPFTAFGLNTSLHIGYVPRNASICPGFYLSKDIEDMRKVFAEQANTLATAYLKKDQL